MTLVRKNETVIDTFVPAKAVDEIIHLEQTKRGIDDRLQELRAKLLETTKQNDVISLKTDKYTITRATRKTIKVTNDKKVKEYLEAQGHQVITKEVLDMRYMKPLVEAHIDNLDGAIQTETEYIAIRINK